MTFARSIKNGAAIIDLRRFWENPSWWRDRWYVKSSWVTEHSNGYRSFGPRSLLWCVRRVLKMLVTGNVGQSRMRRNPNPQRRTA